MSVYNILLYTTKIAELYANYFTKCYKSYFKKKPTSFWGKNSLRWDKGKQYLILTMFSIYMYIIIVQFIG